MTARFVFWDSTGAVRPPWRLLVFCAASIASLIVLNGVVAPLANGVLAPAPVRLTLFLWVRLASAALGHAITFRLVDRRGWRSVRLDRSALRLRAMLASAALGILAVAFATVPLLAIGWLRVVPGPAGSSIGLGLTILWYLAPAALWEELVFRGYGFSVLAEWWGTPAALGITSLAFGLVHLQNEGATVASVCVVVIAGLFLGAVLVTLRSLWAAFAAHLAWNWALAGALHSAVSGVPFATPDYRVIDAGPDWATGGVWGPEGGLPAALSLLLITFYLYTRRPRREES